MGIAAVFMFLTWGALVAHLWRKRHIKKNLFIARIGNAVGKFIMYIISCNVIIFSTLEIS